MAEALPLPAKPGGKPPHVVMLVDNPVVGDSRVQKQARSIAERGWRVTIVGRRLDPHEPDSGTIGDVPVRFVYVTVKAGTKPEVEAPTLFRSPLAYATLRSEVHADGIADARLTAARTAIDELIMAGRHHGPRRWRTQLALKSAIVRRKVVDRRLTASRTLRGNRQFGTGSVERLAARFWTLALRDRAWQRLDPNIWDWERAYAVALEGLDPDVIHANDHRMLHVAAREKLRAGARGRAVRVVWDVHEYLKGVQAWTDDPRWKVAQESLERNFAPYADAVVTVSERLADMLTADFSLPERPAVVLNAPVVTDPPATCPRDVRSDCGLGPETPLVVYSGGAAPQRGLKVMIDALPDLPGVHTAFVILPPGSTGRTDQAARLVARAEAAGVGDRVHVLEYVDPEQVVTYLSTADVGVFAGLRYVNHTISLITKFLEYSQARLPVVVSNLKTMAETVAATGQGEVFEPKDIPGYVAAVSKVLADPAAYRRAYDDADRMRAWTWEPQADILHSAYCAVLARPPTLRGIHG
jgi:glycosyltransferase involved in cell wall biosynthesis